jgi:hypothetical protein
MPIQPDTNRTSPGRGTDPEDRESHARFHATWEALMRQLDRVNSLAHLRHPRKTEGQEAVSIAKHLLDKLGSYPELGGDAT